MATSLSDRTRTPLERQLIDGSKRSSEPDGVGDHRRPALDLAHLFDVQLASRHCDLAARWLRSQGKGYYTIGSAGHESNAIVAMATRPTDPALLHYRSGGFYLGRAGLPGVSDILAGVVAATSEPISGRPAQGVRPRTIWRSSRRRRPSRRTCRAPSAWRSRSTAPRS